VRLAIIPGRGGSVRIPRKNIREFFGKPIIAYSIELAIASKFFDRVVGKYGAEALMRPEGFADVGTQEIGRLVVEQCSDAERIPNLACVIYATCPLLTVEDLAAGKHAMGVRYPCFAMAVGQEPLRDAGAFYWGEGWAFLKREPLIGPRTCMVPIPEERICDINTMADFERAERMYATRRAVCTAS
jgi:pseudaminic acid cytidylyltransferase